MDNDLSKVTTAAEEGAVLEVKWPDDTAILKPDGSPVTIRLRGMESKEFKKTRNSTLNRYIKKRGPNRGDLAPDTAEEGIEDQAAWLAAATIGWDGIVDEGQEIECNFVNAKKLYIKHDFLRVQVNTFIGEQRNFWKASSTT